MTAPGGTSATSDPSYVTQIAAVRAAGVSVLGYVDTAYGTVPLTTVEAEISDYLNWYHVDGVFLDEVSTSCTLANGAGTYYSDLSTWIRSQISSPSITLNPRTQTSSCYLAVGDVIVNFEGDAATYIGSYSAPPWVASERLAALRTLSVGITTIRDLGDRSYLGVELREWFSGGGEIGPANLAAGPPITVTNGHCWFMGGEADGVDGVRQAVRDHVSHGVDGIKIMTTGGNMTPTLGPHESQYTLEEVRCGRGGPRPWGSPTDRKGKIAVGMDAVLVASKET
ncbi:MAG: hypothetical protein NVS3B21_12220 [Acidimicrobiales bacterium]